MPDLDRRTISEAAEAWISGHQPTGELAERVSEALGDFVAGRFRGSAQRLREVHDYRRALFGDSRTVGEAAAMTPPTDTAEVDLVARTATHPEKGRLLYHLARSMAPGNMLELGTSIGISAAYIALGMASAGDGRLVTIDASVARAALAARTWSELSVEGIEQVVGYFEDVLDEVLSDLDLISFAYVDGNHRREPTLAYFEQIRRHMSRGLLVFDDIRWSEDMRQCWAEVVASHPSTIDLGWVGIALIE